MLKLSINPLKIHGGKEPLASWIVSLMPPRCKNPGNPAKGDDGWLHYVEPYFGGGAVLLKNDPEGISEVVNDIDGELINFWCVLQNEKSFAKFKRIVEAVPFAEDEFSYGGKYFLFGKTVQGNVDAAVRFFVRCRQSLSGRRSYFSPTTRNRTRRGMNEQASSWLSAIDGLGAVHERIKRVVILNKDALEVISQQAGPRTLFYLDPPYLHETRSSTGEYGNFEMTWSDHVEMLDLLTTIEGRFMLSGYPSEVYDQYAEQNGWNVHQKDVDNKSSKKKKKPRKTETVWTNY